MIENLVTLVLLILLQAVLGFDNLLYVSLESKRAPAHRRTMVRRLGIGIAVGLRIILLFVLLHVIQRFVDPLFAFRFEGIAEGQFNLHSLIVLGGGAFILYTASKEILHMVNIEGFTHGKQHEQSTAAVVTSIVLMNLVFSFDSILSAMALSSVFWVMAVAIVIGGLLMIWLAERVAEFLQRNRMYEVLGLFVLFVVGVMLTSEGGHLAHLHFFGYAVTPMTKTTFYFVLVVLVLTDVVQSRYKRKLLGLPGSAVTDITVGS